MNEPEYKLGFSGWNSPDGKEKVVVPEGGIQAIADSLCKGTPVQHTARKAAEAFVRWQRENPPKPTKLQAIALRELAIVTSSTYDRVEPTIASESAVAIEWVSRMYDAPEQEVPDFDSVRRYANISTETLAEHEWVKSEDYDSLLEAFRRVQKSKAESVRS